MSTEVKNIKENGTIKTQPRRVGKKEDITVEKKVYSPEEIMVMLGLSKTTTYKFLNDTYKAQAPFRVIKLNTILRVPKEGFDAWLKIVG